MLKLKEGRRSRRAGYQFRAAALRKAPQRSNVQAQNLDWLALSPLKIVGIGLEPLPSPLRAEIGERESETI